MSPPHVYFSTESWLENVWLASDGEMSVHTVLALCLDAFNSFILMSKYYDQDSEMQFTKTILNNAHR